MALKGQDPPRSPAAPVRTAGPFGSDARLVRMSGHGRGRTPREDGTPTRQAVRPRGLDSWRRSRGRSPGWRGDGRPPHALAPSCGPNTHVEDEFVAVVHPMGPARPLDPRATGALWATGLTASLRPGPPAAPVPIRAVNADGRLASCIETDQHASARCLARRRGGSHSTLPRAMVETWAKLRTGLPRRRVGSARSHPFPAASSASVAGTSTDAKTCVRTSTDAESRATGRPGYARCGSSTTR